MSANDLVLAQGLRDTRQTFDGWNDHPWRTVGPWAAASAVVALLLLLAVWGVAKVSVPDPTPLHLPGYDTAPTFGDVAQVLWHNGLVLALHSFACVAGFIAGSSLPLQAERHSGLWRRIHDLAGPLAIAFVSAATLFSLATQAYILGTTASTLSAQLHIRPGLLLVGLLPHALPELTALFLPLAAWLIASRRGAWDELLAATFVTTAIAIPVLVLASFVETYVSPHLLALLVAH
jgi:Stage II sporulation protein M